MAMNALLNIGACLSTDAEMGCGSCLGGNVGANENENGVLMLKWGNVGIWRQSMGGGKRSSRDKSSQQQVEAKEARPPAALGQDGFHVDGRHVPVAPVVSIAADGVAAAVLAALGSPLLAQPILQHP